jgi:hypothetical protein
MPTFRFRIYDQRGDRVGHFAQRANEAEAQTLAKEMLRRRGIVRVEVWRNSRHIYEATKIRGRPPKES